MKRAVCVALVCLVLAPLGLGAQPNEPADRPKIGIAFSGGGALGCAHLGVLEVLEEMRVPIDYIAGTSMGSIVGGLYAAGLSTDEMRDALVSTDWSDAFRDKPAREDLSFRRKQEDQRYLLNLELGIGRGGLRVPSGLISGQKLFFLLRKFALPVSGIDDFDDLPIPFRAVATDIETGEVVVLEDGDLARAMRASMAIPGAFAAVDLDGRRLVDGGVVNNLPIDIVRAMGADIVIAIDLGTPISERGEIQSFVQILGQTTSMITRSNVRRQLPDADLVLNPYVRDFGILEFESATAIIEKGVEEARAHVVDLEPYALDEASYAAHRAARPTPPPLPTTVDFIEYRGNERVDSRIIDAQLDVRPGDPLDLDTVAEDLGRVYGLGDFEAVEVSLATRATAEGEVEYGLIIDIREKDWGPTYLHGGLSLTSDFEGEGFDFGLLVNVNRTRLNARGGEWRNDLLVGQRRRLVSELYQPLDFNGRFFVAPSIDILRDRVGLFEGGEEISKLDLESNILRLDVGYQAGRFGEFRLGLYRGTAEAAVDIGRETLPVSDVDLGGAAFGFVLDRLDNVNIAHRGSFVSVEVLYASEDLGADDDYTRVEATMALFGSRGRHTVFGTLDVGASPAEDLPIYDQHSAGGFLSFSGFQPEQLRGQALAIGRLGYYYELSKLGVGLGDSVVVGGWIEVGNVWEEDDDLDDTIVTGTLLLGADTTFGPIYLAYGRAETDEDRIYLSIGSTF